MLFSLVAAFLEFGTSWCFVVVDCYIRDSDGLVIDHNPQFFTFIVRAAGVKFDGRV